MSAKNITLFLVFIVFVNVQTHTVKRDTATQQPNILDSFQKNMMHFKNCIDQSLAMAVDEVNTKQLQPVLSAVGDSLNRVSMAIDDLTKTSSTKSGIEDDN